VASSADSWRQRIAQSLAALPADVDAEAVWLPSVIGVPSEELKAQLTAPTREAAVLVGLIERSAGIILLLTERAAHLEHHPGQVSFPGGRLSDSDEGPVAAALREASEEVGLAPGQAEVLGVLPASRTGTGFTVTPVVAWLAGAFKAQPDPTEVNAAFEVPIEHLLVPGNCRQATRERFGTHFLMHEFHFEEYRIWGATAAILVQFFEVINAKTI